MNSQIDILENNAFAGNKPYKYTLSSTEFDDLVLDYAPDGFQQSDVEYIRSKTYHAVSSTLSVNELSFPKEGKEYLQKAYTEYGIDVDVQLIVEYWDDQTKEYKFYHQGKIDFSTYSIEEIWLKIQLVTSTFEEKVLKRDNQSLDILKHVAIDGNGIEPFPNEPPTLQMPDILIIQDAMFIYKPAGSFDNINHIVPIRLYGTTDFTEAQTPFGGVIDTMEGSFFLISQQDRQLHISGNIVGTVTGGDGVKMRVDFYVRLINDHGIYQSQHLVGSQQVANVTEFIMDVDIDSIIPIPETYSASLVFISIFVGVVNYNTANINIDEEFLQIAAKKVDSYPIYETFLRTLQLMTGTNNPFYSEFFGRTDTPFTVYAQDGELGNTVKGLNFRMASNTSTIPIKFRELFNSWSNIFNLGMEIQGDKCRVEHRDFFYNEIVVVDISERLLEHDIALEIMPDMFYSSIESGYEKFYYEQTGGLDEFNTRMDFSTPIQSVPGSLNIRAKYRADTQGIRRLITAPSSLEGTKDIKGDDDIFMVSAIRNGKGYFEARTDQGFDSVTGGVDPGQSFNLDYTPKRNLLRHGSLIKAGMMHNQSRYLLWQSSDNLTTLATQKVGETEPIVENANVVVGSLTNARWHNEKYIVEAYLTNAEKLQIDANKNGLIKLSETKYGWILSLKTNSTSGKMQADLLRCNLAHVKPTEI